MAIVSDSFPNLINGVSQQAPALRLSSQLEVCENANASVVRGLTKRQPMQHVAELAAGDFSDAFIHPINRASTEQYFVVLTDGDIQVFNLQGAAMTVSAPDGKGYLDCTAPAHQAFKAVTIADTTFIINREQTVALDATLTASQPHEALLWIKQGLIGHEYKVNIDGTVVATYSSATSATLVKTTDVATALGNALTVNVGATYDITVSENLIYLKRKNAADFKITVYDSYGNTALSCIKEKVQLFEDLPAKANPAMLIKIQGTDNSDAAYWVKFVPDNEGTLGKGQWAETTGPAIKTKFDASTMPYMLQRTGPSAFTFKKATWSDRTAGDDKTAVAPSFVGRTLNDIFVYRGRLGVLAGENVILSQAAEFLNFWPTTATTILDDDRIDYKLGGVAVAYLYHAIPFLDQLLLFSDQSQLTLSHGDTLTQKTVASTPTTFFDGQSDVKPVNVGSSIYFTFKRGGYTGVREYFAQSQAKINDAAEITAHCPNYLSDGARLIAASTTLNTAAVITTGNCLWIYQWLWNGNEKVQSAWHKWTFDAPPVGCFFIADTLYVLFQGSISLWLEKCELSKVVDDGLEYIVHLDRRVTLTRDSFADGVSTFTLPYHDSRLRAVSAGTVLTAAYATDTTVAVLGDHETCTFGIPYTFKAVLSQPFIKEQAKAGGTVAVGGPRFQIARYDIRYDNTGYFNVEVKPDVYNSYNYQFTGRMLGSQYTVLGGVALASGVFKVPVRARNEELTVTITNDSFMPCAILSVDWIGNYNPKAQRI